MFLKIFRKLVLFSVLGALVSSCDPPSQSFNSQPLGVGTTAQYKISGQHYKGEITYSKEGYTHWKFSWKNTPVFEFKTYRGLLTVFSEEEGIKHWSKFDTRALDKFLPLEVGHELVLEGRHFSKTNAEGYPFFMTILVRDEAQFLIKDQSYKVFILDYSIIEDHPEGQKTYSKTAWYSPDLEASLRTDYSFENGVFSMRIVDFDNENSGREDEEPHPEGLGTVRL